MTRRFDDGKEQWESWQGFSNVASGLWRLEEVAEWPLSGDRLFWYAPEMLQLSCLCGQIRVELSRRPDFINECNCALCSKAGARWGYFHPSEVIVAGTAKGYRRQDKEDPTAEIRFCENCGSTTHFNLTASAVSKFGNTLMGVNMLLADERDLAGVELRFPDGRAWAGAGEFAYIRDARIIG